MRACMGYHCINMLFSQQLAKIPRGGYAARGVQTESRSFASMPRVEELTVCRRNGRQQLLDYHKKKRQSSNGKKKEKVLLHTSAFSGSP